MKVYGLHEQWRRLLLESYENKDIWWRPLKVLSTWEMWLAPVCLNVTWVKCCLQNEDPKNTRTLKSWQLKDVNVRASRSWKGQLNNSFHQSEQHKRSTNISTTWRYYQPSWMLPAQFCLPTRNPPHLTPSHPRTNSIQIAFIHHMSTPSLSPAHQPQPLLKRHPTLSHQPLLMLWLFQRT
jgi:hypothetical protein